MKQRLDTGLFKPLEKLVGLEIGQQGKLHETNKMPYQFFSLIYFPKETPKHVLGIARTFWSHTYFMYGVVIFTCMTVLIMRAGNGFDLFRNFSISPQGKLKLQDQTFFFLVKQDKTFS